MKSILDPTFKYVKAHETDIRKTFERVKREQAQAQKGADARGFDVLNELDRTLTLLREVKR